MTPAQLLQKLNLKNVTDKFWTGGSSTTGLRQYATIGHIRRLLEAMVGMGSGKDYKEYRAVWKVNYNNGEAEFVIAPLFPKIAKDEIGITQIIAYPRTDGNLPYLEFTSSLFQDNADFMNKKVEISVLCVSNNYNDDLGFSGVGDLPTIGYYKYSNEGVPVVGFIDNNKGEIAIKNGVSYEVTIKLFD